MSAQNCTRKRPIRPRSRWRSVLAASSVLLLALVGVQANAAEVPPEEGTSDSNHVESDLRDEQYLPSPLRASEPTGEPGATAGVGASAAYTQAQCQAQVLALVNVERANVGLPPLILNEGLNSISYMWSDWMATTDIFEHLPVLYGWSFWEATGNISGGENIAAGQPTPAVVMNDWMNSPGHRANILTPGFTHMGLACVEGGPSDWPYIYWTQQFSRGLTTPATEWEHIPVPTAQLSTSIVGQRLEGSQLTASIVGRLPSGTTMSYQWTADGTNIEGATSRTFTPTQAQVGKKMGVTVWAQGDPFFYERTVVPVPTDTQIIKGILIAPSIQISGTPKVGQTLSVLNAEATDFTPTADSVTYQWLRNGTAIPGATSATYKLTSADATRSVSVKVTGVKTHYQDATATVSAGTVAERFNVRRLAGPSRYATNLQVNGVYGSQNKPVFVATGANFADALSVGPAVAVTEGTLYLTPASGMSADALASVVSKNPSAVYVIGGAGAVPESVVNQLRAATGKQPQRIGGGSRYETSANIAATFFGSRAVDYAFVATGRNYPDALSAAAAGGALGAPVLLVDGTAASNLTPAMTNFLSSKSISKVFIAGGDGAVNQTISTNLSKNWSVERLGGSTRYGTNEKVNGAVTAHSGTTPVSGIWIATGTNFPDALSAAAPAGHPSQRLVLSNGSCIPKPVVSSWIKGSGSEVSLVSLVGGEGALKPSVQQLSECN